VRRLRPLAALLAAAALALAGCQHEETKPKGRTVLMSEPERPLTLCERSAKPPVGVADEGVNRSFAAFATDWMKRHRKEGVPRAGHLRWIGDATETELRATGQDLAPYVGILRHCEMTLRCADDDAGRCRLVGRTVVTEIFRFQGGEWVY
jgi:hypothetical protein